MLSGATRSEEHQREFLTSDRGLKKGKAKKKTWKRGCSLQHSHGGVSIWTGFGTRIEWERRKGKIVSLVQRRKSQRRRSRNKKSRRRLLESHKKGGSCRGRVPRGSLWVLQVLFWALFWACPDSTSTEAPDGFWAGQMLQPVAGCGCCGACWLRRCSAGPSGRSSGAQRASSGASSSFLALQGRAWGLARKDYGRVGARSRLGLLVSRCWRGKTSAVWSVRIGGVIARGERAGKRERSRTRREQVDGEAVRQEKRIASAHVATRGRGEPMASRFFFSSSSFFFTQAERGLAQRAGR